jgi:predicted metal-dependent hydrolase
MFNVSFPVEIMYKNIKHTYFKMHDQGLIIHTSPSTPMHLIEAYVQTHQERLEKKFNELQLKEFKLWGQNIQIETKKGPFEYHVFNQKLILQYENMTFLQAWHQVLTLESQRYLETQKNDIQARLKTFNIQETPYQLKFYKSKFGSYHRKLHLISFNVFLATLEPDLFLYVIYHEYAHTIHFHHQKAFHELLESLLPHHKIYEKKLKSLVIYSHYTV